jgi:hypothetical protein
MEKTKPVFALCERSKCDDMCFLLEFLIFVNNLLGKVKKVKLGQEDIWRRGGIVPLL